MEIFYIAIGNLFDPSIRAIHSNDLKLKSGNR